MLFPITLVPFEDVQRVEVFDADTRQGLGARDSRVLHPRLQQLERPRLVSEGVSAAGGGFESRSQQVTAVHCKNLPMSLLRREDALDLPNVA